MANEIAPGDHIGKYRILSHIATGGMGTVYKALDESVDRLVALKVLSPELTANPILVERFRREAKHAGRLNHRNIVTLYEFGQHEGSCFLALEYVQGIDLAEHIARRGKLRPEESRRITLQAAKALVHAFEQGVTHRDIKPSNFLLSHQGQRLVVKLTDLGLARTINEEEFRVTRAGTTVGTVDYMAPEQARDSTSADIRSDIYSLGCTLYQMLTGQPPFAEGGLGERVYKHLAVEPADVRQLNPEVPAGLWFVLQRMLAKAPDDRYQTPTELIEALKHMPVAPARLSPPPADLLPAAATPPAPPEAAPAPAPAPAAPAPGPKPGSSAITPTMPSMPVALDSPPQPRREEVTPPGMPVPPPPERPKRRTTLPDMDLGQDTQPAQLGLSPEQVQAAAGQFERGCQIIQQSGPTDYALQLLLSCCALDPTNLRYRQRLREALRSSGAKRGGGWLGSLSLGNMSARGKVKSALRAGDHLKVLELGEKYLMRVPDDVSVPSEMAESAQALGLMGLAVWLLDQARPNDTGTTVIRALANLYEKLRRYRQAIALWEKVREAHPTDSEAGAKIKELSVNDTIARGNYGR
jgi:serine/threonine-protein kinase